jgi:hopanoid-associated phosphorylase
VTVASALLIVVGLTREAAIAAPHGQVAIGARALDERLDPRVTGIVSFGLCGALDPSFAVGDLLVADGLTHQGEILPADARWAAALRAALPHARAGAMAGGEVIVGSVAAKSALRRATGAVAVDMESLAVARAARAAGLPFAILRAVSDTAAQALPRAAQAGFREGGEPDIPAVIGALLLRPWELPSLIRTAGAAERAFKSLGEAAKALTAPPS